MYTLKTNYARKENYGAKRATSAIKYIVIHMTANDGDKAESNGKYFHNNVVKASAHYFVDDTVVLQSVPDNYVAYAVGGSKYSNCSKTGGGKLYKVCTNANSISIELCDTVKNGVVYPSNATIANAVALCKTLMAKYNVPIDRVIRHFDVTGKECPRYWMDNAKFESCFKSLVKGTTIVQTPSQTVVTAPTSYSVGKTYKLYYDSYVWSKPLVSSATISLAKYANLPNVSGNILKAGSTATCEGVVKEGNNIWLKCPLGYLPAYYNGRYNIK